MSIKGKCNSCCVPGCNSNSTPSFRNRGGRITTFKLPRDEKRRKEWIQAIPKRKYPPTVNHNVCILHFNEEDFSRNNRRIDLKKCAVPSIFPFVNGQRNDENGDVCDEAWTEYEAYRKDSANRIVENVSDDLPTSTSDLSRILIDRLRLPGSKYFGIDTDIIIEPDSDNESDISEQTETTNCDRIATINKEKRPRRKKIKLDTIEPETHFSSVEFESDEFDITDTKSYIEEPSVKSDEQLNVKTSIDSGSSNIPNDADKFGAMVSSKLLLMSPLQRLMSQKIISEILLKGQLGMLRSSLSPVLVTGYMKNISNGTTNTTNVTTSEHLSYYNNVEDDDDDDDGSEDPLMFQVKQEESRETTNFESFGNVKNEISWSDDDEN